MHQLIKFLYHYFGLHPLFDKEPFFSFKYDKDIPRNNPPIMLPKVTGNKLFNNISFIVIVLSNKYPNDR